MRSFNFKVKLIGDEKYLTYIMGEETELDEDVLDYCEENDLKELVKIIYEEDDDYDYLTYDITGCKTVDELLAKEMKCEDVLMVLRNISNGLISLKEQAVKLNYILLNRQFMYIDELFNIRFICLPVESSGGLAAEFKGFVRQFLANIRYDVDQDLNYVGKLLTYINGDNFNLRGLVGLSEALMEEAGIGFEEVDGIEADGVEVMNSEDVEPEGDSIKDFMESLSGGSDEPLPEIGDDDVDDADEEPETSDDGDLESILPAGMKFETAETDADDTAEASESTENTEGEPVEDNTEADGDEATDAVTTENASDAEDKQTETEKDSTDAEADVTQPAEDNADTEAAGEEAANKEDENTSAVSSEAADGDNVPEKTVSETGTTDNLKKDEPKASAAQQTEKAVKTTVKETDPEVLKNRIKALAGNEKTELKKKEEVFHNEQEMDAFLGSKPPVIKKNSVKVNRAAIIQNIAASEEEAELAAKEKEEQVPVIEEISENINQEKKPKSNSILSKTVETQKPQSVNVVNIAKAMPYLIRVNTKERIMLRKEVFKIGKASIGVDYTVSGNGAISRQHAVIVRRDDVSYIKDNKSTNHTYVNDKVVGDGEEVILTHDSMIRLGDEEFIFKIR